MTAEEKKAAEKAAKEAAALAKKKAKELEGNVVWLTWDEQRIWVIHPQRGGNMLSTLTNPNATLTREQVKEALKQQSQLNILPGLHSYPARLWEQCKEHDDVNQALADGRLSVGTNEDFGLEGEAADPAQELPATLEEVATGNARNMAENCQDLKVLQGWLEAEKKGLARGTVLTELEAQIEIVKETEKTLSEATGAN